MVAAACGPPTRTELLEWFIADLFWPVPDNVQIKVTAGKENSMCHGCLIEGAETVPSLICGHCHKLLKAAQLMRDDA